RRVSDALATAERAEASARRALHHADLRAAMTGTPQPGPATAAPAEIANDPSGRPAVTVIIPVHNTESYLRECLDSVLGQSGVAVEVVCVDDGSTDGSGRILDAYATRDDRFRVVHQANTGPSGARNTGMAAATGRYVCFLDSDDSWRLDELAELVRLADSADLDLVMFDAVSQREPGVDDRLWARYRDHYARNPHPEPRTGIEMVADLAEAGEYRPSACLYLARREFLDRVPLRFYPGITHEDDLFTFGAMLHASRVSHVSTAFYARRIRPGSIVTAGDRVASARGYFIAYVEMLRALASHGTMERRAAAAMGDLAYVTFRGARHNVVRLSEDLVERLAEVDPAPDAQAAFLLLRRAWLEERQARLLTKRLKLAIGGSGRPGGGWRRHPLVQALKPSVKRLLGRT
ncbi:MAG: glycosyltransferase, partial [Propionibacteriaceae bacterium]|nr:glycosyltransferase [Propionibacteriaceae bacterium]